MTMKKRQYNAGMAGFFLGGICAISAGVLVSILRDQYQLSYGFSGTLVSAMSIGNMIALLISGILPGSIGEKGTTLLLSIGAFLGYLLMALTGNPVLLLLAFLLVGVSKGCTANKCTLLVSNNTSDKQRALSLLNACFAFGALLCPFLISFLQRKSSTIAMLGVSATGLLLWLVFLTADLPGKPKTRGEKSGGTDFSFLHNTAFWILALLLFCQNAAEYTVNGWLVTYYKNEQILSGALAAYTVTVQWSCNLFARLLLAFVLKVKKPFQALSLMGVGITVMYAVLLRMHTALPALIVLGLFSFSIAGVYPMTIACVGDMTSSASLGFLLSFAGIGGIIFPWLVGIIADGTGLRTGMIVNLIPCAGVIVLPLLMIRHNRSSALHT
ncbi:MAG: MFS transporter [Oscillospiraceae bacterium]|nr:MFS transporter [Oscillospiraceae bacterium]